MSRRSLLLPLAALATSALLLSGCAGGGSDRDGSNNREVIAAARTADVTTPGSIVAFGEPARFVIGSDATGRFEVVINAPTAGDDAWYAGQQIFDDHIASGGSLAIVTYTNTALDDAAAAVTNSKIDVSPYGYEGDGINGIGTGYGVNERGADQCLAHDPATPLAVGESATGCLPLLVDLPKGELPPLVGMRGDGDFAIYDSVYWDAGEQ